MKAFPRFDYQCIPVNSTTTVRLMLSLSGEGIAASAPINIAMVIDRSASMQRGKIAKVKEAACMIAKMLKPTDIFSLVAFNDTVETIVPTAKGADLVGVEVLINKITATGNTNLSGGYERAGSLAHHAGHNATSRIVLLSDGQANRGVTRPDLLAEHAQKFRYLGISTTTFGVGHDFDEQLMTMLAEQGGGSANYIEQPWHAAEVFREELEDLRSIAATNAEVAFQCGGAVVSCVPLNNFPERGAYNWLVGDIYGVRERRIVLELVIKTGAQAEPMNVGAFTVSYTMPGGGKPVTLDVPIAINVVPDAEFTGVVPDREITLEAAMLAVGKAKAEALFLARNRNFSDAADLLENYRTALLGLGLNDPELDMELNRLQERAWQLRNRGEEYFNAAERKNFTYEADLAMKGKMDKYRAMRERHAKMNCIPSNRVVTIISRLHGQGNQFTVDNPPTRAVYDFMAEVFRKLKGAVEAGSYGKSWLMREASVKRTFDLGSSWARAQHAQIDQRLLDEVELSAPICLEVIPLPPLTQRKERTVPQEKVTLDFSLLGTQQRGNLSLEYRESILACDFLATVYEQIRSEVPPNSYGKHWALRDTATGRVFDFGSAWAKYHNMPTDTRPIGKIGINRGSLLQVIQLPQ